MSNAASYNAAAFTGQRALSPGARVMLCLALAVLFLPVAVVAAMARYAYTTTQIRATAISPIQFGFLGALAQAAGAALAGVGFDWEVTVGPRHHEGIFRALACCNALLIPLVAIAVGLIAESYERLRRLGLAGRCPTCNYDLTGNTSGRCPECGTEIPAERMGRQGDTSATSSSDS